MKKRAKKSLIPFPENAKAKYAPKSMGRWLLNIDGFDSFLFFSCSRPTVTVINQEKFFGELTVQMSDPINPSGAKQVQTWLDADQNIRAGELKLLDSVGVVIESWTFPELELKYVDFGDLSYDQLHPTKITMKLKPTKKGYVYWSV